MSFSRLVFALLSLLWVPVATGSPKPNKQIADLTQTLLGADVPAAAAAARALGEAKQPAAVNALLDALATGVHPDVAVAAVTALGNQDRQQTMEALLTSCRHRSAAVRKAAITALEKSADKRADACVESGLDDFDAAVRGQAIAAVLKRRLPVVPELFILFERGDPAGPALATLGDVEVAEKVAKKMGELPDAEVASVLGGMLRRKDLGAVDTRRDWVDVLGKLPTDAAVNELEAYLKAVPTDRKKPAGRLAQAILEARKDKSQ